MSKRIINFLFLLIISSSLIFPQSIYYKDKLKNQIQINEYLYQDFKQELNLDFIRLDSLIANFINNSSIKYIFQYNQNHKITEWIMLDNFGSGWGNNLKNIFLYDNNNNLISEYNLGWSIYHWDSLSKIIYNYDMGVLSQSIFQIYNNSFWENLSRSNYIYDQNQNLQSTLIERWIDNKWQNSFLITNYISQNRIDSILFRKWQNNDWQNDRKTIFYFAGNQIDVDSIIVKNWDGVLWLNMFKREIVNDSNHNQILQIDKEWNAGSWVNSIKRFYTYNDFNLIQYVYCEIWSGSQWISGDGDILFNYPFGFIVTIISNNVSAYYSRVVSIDKNNLELNEYYLSQNYPNPFNPTTKLKFSIPQSDFVQIKVYDLLGREVQTLLNEFKAAGNYEIEFSTEALEGARSLPSGVYFYRMISGSFVENKKMILLR